MPSRSILYIVLVIMLSAGLRFWGVGVPAYYTGDEAEQVPASREFIRSGNAGAFWHHPHFGYALLDGCIRLLGDNPYGWRSRNCLLGSLSVLLVFLISMEVFGSGQIALLAALMLALDPLHVAMSRTTFDEIPASFFFLAAVYFVIRYLKGHRGLTAAGLMMGFSLACKEYYSVCVVALLVFVLLYLQDKERPFSPKRIGAILSFILLPASVYLLSYLPWFGSGHDLADFAHLESDSLRDLSNLTWNWFGTANQAVLGEGGPPAAWFLLPRIFGLQIGPAEDFGKYIVFMNNPPIWFLIWPAATFCVFKFRKTGNSLMLLPTILFASAYLPLLILNRPILLYSAVPLLPFVFIAVSFMLGSLPPVKGKIWCYRSMMGMVLLWGLYIYPLASYKQVPLFYYRPFLSWAKIFRVA